ncbi:MAG: hypothetical protein WC867_03020 [Candidatus Pacearchaeota archaeon]|jgi:hypothetical protein
MKKETFQKKWYFRVIQIFYWVSLILISIALLIISLYEDDIPMAGFFWLIIILFIYWLIKRIFYYLMFGTRIFPKKNKK